ncbi:MAG: UPF0280 family protein [Spirochaetes bacterium]|nr:UPF0280 family protein [Spirochaetota bacterium]MBN2770685.1 UPF0280 family protein [Spirochaetota bacterium]
MIPEENKFTYKDSNFTIHCSYFSEAKEEIIFQRTILEKYLEKDPYFKSSLTPLAPTGDAPLIVKTMCAAAEICNTGPMAAVAGTIAQFAWQKVFDIAPNDKIIIENGGDIYLSSSSPIYIGIFAGKSILSGKLALKIAPEETPLGICSSSGTMGHSLSMGNCDLATVFAKNNAIADCAATMAANIVKTVDDLEKAADYLNSINEIRGGLIIKGDRIVIVGDTPEIIKNSDKKLTTKITKAEGSIFSF